MPRNRFEGLPGNSVGTAMEAMRALERGAAAQALALLDRLPDHAHPELLRLRGLALMQRGDPAAALVALREAAGLWPDDALSRCQLGVALAQTGDVAAARDAFVRAVNLDPALVDGWYNLGHAHDALADTASAREAFATVLRLAPDHAGARVQHAAMLRMLGDLTGAERELLELIARDPDSIPSWVGLSRLKTFQPSPAQLDQLCALRASGRLPAEQLMDFDFALGAFLEAAGRYREALARFNAANAAKRRTVRWNAETMHALVDRILGEFDQASTIDEHGTRGRGAIFLVGMPRSGSTLAEQIISAHPRVQAGGEHEGVRQVLLAESQRLGRPYPEWVAAATPVDWDRMGENYLRDCRRWRDDRPFFTDKTLANWQAVGAIRRMLPGAVIVHCRRDPLETLWSCFKHNFDQAQFFSHEFDELVAFWHDSERAMAAWRARWPGVVHPFELEALLARPEASIRALLAACGLDFDPACLDHPANRRPVRTASAAQVRQPLRGTRAVAGCYGELLAPLRTRIERVQGHPGPRHRPTPSDPDSASGG